MRLARSARIWSAFPLVVILATGCSHARSHRSSIVCGGQSERGPIIKLVLEPALFRERCCVEIFPGGLVISTSLGAVRTNFIGASRVSDLMAKLFNLGFPDMDQYTLESEFVAAAAKAGQGLAIADGMNVTLSIRTASKTVTVSWPEPRVYSEAYPCAKGIRTFVECIDLVQAAVRQP